ARRRLLDDGSFGRQIAAQDRDATFLEDGIAQRPYDILLPGHARRVQVDLQSLARNGECFAVEQRLQLVQDRGETTGVVQVLHVVLTRGFEVDEHRRLTPDVVEC